MRSSEQDAEFLLSLVRPGAPLAEFAPLGDEVRCIALAQVLRQIGHDAVPMSCKIQVPMHGGFEHDLLASAIRVDGKVMDLSGVVGEREVVQSTVEAMRQRLEYSEVSLHRRKKPKPGNWEVMPEVMCDRLLALSRFHARVNGGARVEDFMASALAQVSHRKLDEASVPTPDGAHRPRF